VQLHLSAGDWQEVGLNDNNYQERIMAFFTQKFKPAGWGNAAGFHQQPYFFMDEWMKPLAEHLAFMFTTAAEDARSRCLWPLGLRPAPGYHQEPYLRHLRNRLQCLHHLPDQSWRPVMLAAMFLLTKAKRGCRPDPSSDRPYPATAPNIPLVPLLDEVAKQLECLMVCICLSKGVSKANKGQLQRNFLKQLQAALAPGSQLSTDPAPLSEDSVAARCALLRNFLAAAVIPIGLNGLGTRPANLQQQLTQRDISYPSVQLARALLLMWSNQRDGTHAHGGVGPLYYGRINVCHIMPPSLGPNWLGYAGWDAGTHGGWVARLGNLCLLETSTITSMQDRSWQERRVIVEKASQGTNHMYNSLASRQPFELNQQWTIAACQQRTAEMAQLLAVQRWHLPPMAAGKSGC
jgi:hypothetical protein